MPYDLSNLKRDTFRRQKQLANVTMPVHGQSDRNSDGITHQFSTAPPSSLAPHGAGAPMDKNSTINSNDSPLIEGQRNYAAAQLELKSNSSRQCGHEDLNALMGYIQQLELSLTKKDELLASQDDRIETLKSEVNLMKNRASAFCATATDELLAPTTPNQVSDESGEAELEGHGSWSRSLSHISKAPSSGEESIAEPAANGRWNIPFDDSFEELVAKSPSEKATGMGFVPVGERSRQSSTGVLTKPVPRCFGASSFIPRASAKSALQEATNDKENMSPMRSETAVNVGTYRNIR